MNNKVILSAVLSAFVLGSAVAQEYDDMYFTKKDRAKVQADRGVSLALSEKKRQADEAGADEEINPTDSYSSRNVNPEFTSRANSQTAQADNEDYFVSNYHYNNSYTNWNNSFNNWYNNPWYTSGYWGSRMNNWNSPFYGYNDPWGSPFGNPYYRSGMYSSMWYGSSWGYGLGSGWGMSYNYYDPWSSPWGMSPYYGMSPYWGSSYAYSPYAGWYRTPRVVVVDRTGQGVVYGKRSSRSSGVVQSTYGSTNARSYSNTGSGSRSDRGARVSTSSTRQSDYYEPWRNQSRSGNASGTNSSSSPSRTSTWDNNSSTPSRTSTWDNSNSRSTYRQSSPTPSRTHDGGGSRSSGGSSGGSSGSRSSRGRGN